MYNTEDFRIKLFEPPYVDFSDIFDLLDKAEDSERDALIEDLKVFYHKTGDELYGKKEREAVLSGIKCAWDFIENTVYTSAQSFDITKYDMTRASFEIFEEKFKDDFIIVSPVVSEENMYDYRDIQDEIAWDFVRFTPMCCVWYDTAKEKYREKFYYILWKEGNSEKAWEKYKIKTLTKYPDSIAFINGIFYLGVGTRLSLIKKPEPAIEEILSIVIRKSSDGPADFKFMQSDKINRLKKDNVAYIGLPCGTAPTPFNSSAGARKMIYCGDIKTDK